MPFHLSYLNMTELVESERGSTQTFNLTLDLYDKGFRGSDGDGVSRD